jgi:hypothetical protein
VVPAVPDAIAIELWPEYAHIVPRCAYLALLSNRAQLNLL